MKQYSFATIITCNTHTPVATPLPFVVSIKDGVVILTSHFAKANTQWADIEASKVLVIFWRSACLYSASHYNKPENVPTWNYFAVHAYGQEKIIAGTNKTFNVLEATINTYKAAYKKQWQALQQEYKLKMIKGITGFEIVVTELQAKKKLSQNRTATEQQKIAESLSQSSTTNGLDIAKYIKQNILQ